MQLNVKIQFSGHLVVHEIGLLKTSLILLATRLFTEGRGERANLFLFGKTEAKNINSIMYSIYLVAYLSSYHEKAINALYELA